MRGITAFVGIALVFASAGLAGERPVAVSPGEVSRVAQVELRCPTFSWAEVAGAESYELVVYRLEPEGAEAEPILRRSFDGAIYSWTPPLEDCLGRGGRYGWSLRVTSGGEPTAWSVPRLFEVARGPSRAQFEEALAIVQDYLESEEEVERAASEQDFRQAPVASRSGAVADGESAKPSADFQIIGTTGELAVVGEVRTVDPSGAPRLWGRGRPNGFIYGIVGGFCSNNGVRFGLSRAVTDWGSAADACPAGSWVCTSAERGTGTCTTGRRFDIPAGYLACDGIITAFQPGADHLGWVADANVAYYPAVRSEDGATSGATEPEACKGFPVWCCFY